MKKFFFAAALVVSGLLVAVINLRNTPLANKKSIKRLKNGIISQKILVCPALPTRISY